MALKRTRRSAATWGELMDRQRASGLSVTDYCQREGLSRSVFTRWRARLSARATRAVKRVAVGKARPAPASFVEVGELIGAPCTLRLELGGGVVLTIERG